jgi:hypothetical protein
VSLQAIAVVTKSDLDVKSKATTGRLAQPMKQESRAELLKKAWQDCEKMLTDALEVFVGALANPSPQ